MVRVSVAGMVRVWWQVKLCDPFVTQYTWAISERFRDTAI